MDITFLAIGLVVGILFSGVATWLWAKQKYGSGKISENEFSDLQKEVSNLNTQLATEKERSTHAESELSKASETNVNKEKEIREFTANQATLKAEFEAAIKNETLAKDKLVQISESLELEKKSKNAKDIELGQVEIERDGIARELKTASEKLSKTEEQLEKKTNEFNGANKEVATLSANNESLEEKLDKQKTEIEEIGKQFNKDFELIASKILEEKTNKFTTTNKTNMETILKPLGENLESFRKKVDDVYDKEAKERFSLGEKVKELAELNQVISQEARNLTNALKSESKTQGGWGEMILESVLEKSGLRKDEEYFMEHQLLDENGVPLRSESEGKKMRPDAVIKYPDNRSVIIDSKVSLNAFTRYIAATDAEEQGAELAAHVAAIKTHIVSLSTKGYDDYDKALDFVMMFIPSEPAYIAAIQGDSNLWNFAYDKRILLLNPTNLITSLKLIVDLWKREYQNQNAIDIAERGAKLYDKFVGFVSNLEGVGDYLHKAQVKYTDAHKQLSTGNDNLVLQATKLKDLGLKPKKKLKEELVNSALTEEIKEVEQ